MASPLDYLFSSNPMAYQALSGLFGEMPFDERYAPAAQATQPGVGPGNWDWFGPSPGPGAQPPQAQQPQQQAMAFNQPQSAPSFPALPQLRNTSQPGDANFYGGSPEANRNLQPFGARPPQMAAGAMAQAPTMPPTGQSPGAMDRFSAGLQGAGSSFMNGGGPIGALVNLIGGLTSGKRTDPEGVNQEEMMKQYQSWQKDFNLTPAQARMMVLNKEYMKEAVKPVANPSYITGQNGVIYSQGPGGLNPAAVAPKPEFQKRINSQGQEELVAVTPPTGLSPMSVTGPGQNTSGGIGSRAGGGGVVAPGSGLVTGLSPQQKNEQETYGKSLGDRHKEINAESAAATRVRPMLDRMRQLNLDPKLPEGELAPAFQKLRSALISLGVPVNSVKAGEELTALHNKMTIDMNPSGSLGAGFSNADRDYLDAVNPAVNNTKLGRTALIDAAYKINERKQEIATEAIKYKTTHQGSLDGFEAYIADWANKRPLFPDAPPSGSAAPPPSSKPIEWERGPNGIPRQKK